MGLRPRHIRFHARCKFKTEGLKPAVGCLEGDVVHSQDAPQALHLLAQPHAPPIGLEVRLRLLLELPYR